MTQVRSTAGAPPVITEVLDTEVVFVPLPPQPPSPQSRRSYRPSAKRLVPQTLAAKLVTGVVALIVVIVSIVGCATYYSLRTFLNDRLDQQVTSLANNQNLLSGRYGPAAEPASTSGPTALWFAFLSPDGTPDASLSRQSDTLHDMLLSPDDARALLQHPLHRRTLTTTDGTELVVQQSTTQFSNVPPGTAVVVGLSTSSVHETLHRLVRLEVLLGAAAVLLAALLTSAGVRAGLRPLKRVSRTAQEVTAELGPDGAGLERRVPGPEDTTEVGQVASSINRLLETVETEFRARVASEERMRQFLADASHELRTPLTSIRGYAELSRLKGGSKDPDDPMRRIETEGTRMSRLVEDLLVLARGDQDALTMHKPVQIDQVLTEAADVAGSAHPEREFHLQANTGAVVIGDHDQLVRLLVNLLNNAATHTSPDKPIYLNGVTGYTETGAAVALRVVDSGPGLAPQEAAHVFERFWRADKARSRVKGGSGLGMAIVAQIVEAHQGHVRFDSTVESGTTVTVTLPTVPAELGVLNSISESAGTLQN